MASAVFLHPGEPIAPHDVWNAWNGEPTIWLAIGLVTLIYAWGVYRAWRQAGPGRAIAYRQAGFFLGAILALAAALISPLDALSSVLLSAHMTQHLVLILAAAPLLVLSDFGLALLWALPRRTAQTLSRQLKRRQGVDRAWRSIRSPVGAWLIFTITLWVWHAPVLYESALRDEVVHALEHGIFLAAAVLFWSVLFSHGKMKHARSGEGIPYLFTTLIQSSIFGALMTFGDQPWYAFYQALTPTWGLSPLQDQQLAGLIMWLPGGAVFTLLTIYSFAAWLRAQEGSGAAHRLPAARHENLTRRPRSLQEGRHSVQNTESTIRTVR